MQSETSSIEWMCQHRGWELALTQPLTLCQLLPVMNQQTNKQQNKTKQSKKDNGTDHYDTLVTNFDAQHI